MHSSCHQWGKKIAGLLLGMMACGFSTAAEPKDFAAATRESDRVSQPSQASTLNGQTAAQTRANVEKIWNDIPLSKEGQPIAYVVRLQTDVGNIDLEFFPEDAPNHVRSFLALTKTGFFDGLIFHRCIPGFVIQGGCPQGTGMGGPGYALKQEFNARPHVRGMLSMARAQAYDSAGSQFFICTGEPRQLDFQYTVFGKVKAGMEVVDRIVNAPKGPGDRPITPVKIQKATILAPTS